MVDTRHAVGCAALRGGVPCTCWLDKTAGQTPLWLAVQRLKEATGHPHEWPLAGRVTVMVGDLQAVLTALHADLPSWPPIEEGGEG